MMSPQQQQEDTTIGSSSERTTTETYDTAGSTISSTPSSSSKNDGLFDRPVAESWKSLSYPDFLSGFTTSWFRSDDDGDHHTSNREAKEVTDFPNDFQQSGEEGVVLQADADESGNTTAAGAWTVLVDRIIAFPTGFAWISSSSSWNETASTSQEEHIFLWIVFLSVLLCLMILLLWRRRRKRMVVLPSAGGNRRRANSSTGDLMISPSSGIMMMNRPRAISSDTTTGLFPRVDDGLLVSSSSSSSAANNSNTKKDLFPVVMGPSVATLVYSTHTPPLAWSEASKKLLPKDTKTRSQKKVVLDVRMRTITTQGVNTNDRHVQTTLTDDVSVHVKTPVEGAVLELYNSRVKNQKQEWMEHTFPTALDAAQFQYDLLGCQVLGAAIRHMYDALEVVHKGSLAHDGKECLLHDSESDEQIKKGSVAWDDAMRCFSGLASVRSALEKQLAGRLLLMMSNQDEDASNGGDVSDITAEYADKRQLLGPVDFFRLFVPLIPTTSFPYEESNPQRMEQLLRARKLVAEAAVLVQSFVAARIVVNRGWNLPVEESSSGYLTRRLAYDANLDNVDRDKEASNEYYEATVSRDVKCTVHSRRHLKSHGASGASAYQAYSLVGSHVFKLPPKGEAHPLKPSEDPVEALPSLRRMIEAHPDLDFFVCAFFPEGIRVGFVHVFVRSLPRGVDLSFDRIIDMFVSGTAEDRKRKFEVFMQLGPGSKLSPLTWAALKAVTMLFRWTRRGETQIPPESGADRTPFPGMTLGNYTESRHFGGSLRTDPSLPSNYVSVTSHIDVNQMSNVAVRALYERLEEGALPACIVDFTFVLEGEKLDELPERALASVRLVHVDPVEVALPTYYSAVTRIEASNQVVSFLPEMVQAPLSTEAQSLASASVSAPRESSRRSAVDDAEAFGMGVDALMDILQGVTVPVRSDRKFLATDRQRGDDLTDRVPVLELMTRNDLERYFIAAECHLKSAAVRVVRSAAWRQQTFPIHVDECRVELQSGQFFQQGCDVMGRPVFYFQNMCLGPWRKDEDALISALLYRLEKCIRREKPTVKCTVIINMGKPLKRNRKPKKKKDGDEDTATNADDTRATTTVAADEGDTSRSVTTETTTASTWNPLRKGANPRLNPTETYSVHTNSEAIRRLVETLQDHYPERLHKALILPGDMFTGMGGSLTIRSYISSRRTRSKVIVVSRATELRQHVNKSELSTIVGGSAAVPRSAFECA